MSNDKPERSPGGSKILRHQSADRESNRLPEVIATEPTEEIEQYFTRVFGEPEQVFHELVSDIVHIDVHIIPPRPERDQWTLFTTGMSALPMTVPQHIENADRFSFAELMVVLPSYCERRRGRSNHHAKRRARREYLLFDRAA